MESWILIRLSDGKAVREVFDERLRLVVERYNRTATSHRLIPVGEYLRAYNRAVKLAGGVEPNEITD
jgi:hypothetical protein